MIMPRIQSCRVIGLEKQEKKTLLMLQQAQTAHTQSLHVTFLTFTFIHAALDLDKSPGDWSVCL